MGELHRARLSTESVSLTQREREKPPHVPSSFFLFCLCPVYPHYNICQAQPTEPTRLLSLSHSYSIHLDSESTEGGTKLSEPLIFCLFTPYAYTTHNVFHHKLGPCRNPSEVNGVLGHSNLITVLVLPAFFGKNSVRLKKKGKKVDFVVLRTKVV